MTSKDFFRFSLLWPVITIGWLFLSSFFTSIIIAQFNASENISSTRGLSLNTVNSILQDNDGFLWIATGYGLNRYDGYSFKTFLHDPLDTNTISDNIIRALHIDKTGCLWIGTENGLNRFDKKRNRFVHYFSDPSDFNSLSDNSIQCILQTKDSSLWVGTMAGGLSRLDMKTQKFKSYQYNTKYPGAIGANYITCMAEDFESNLWIGCVTRGLHLYKPEADSFSRFVHDPSNPNSISNNSIRSLFVDKNGIVWVGTMNGLNKMIKTNKSITFESSRNPLIKSSANWINNIYSDRDNTMWISFLGDGIYQFNPSKKTFSPAKIANINDNSPLPVNCIYEDCFGLLWFGTFDNGLFKQNKQNSRFSLFEYHPDYSGLSGRVVTGVVEDRNGNVWVSTLRGGLNQISGNDKTQQITWIQAAKNDPYRADLNKIFTLLIDRQNIAWIATNAGLLSLPLSQLEAKKVLSLSDLYSINNEKINTVIFDLLEDHDGILWAIGLGGLMRIDKNRVTPEKEPYCIYTSNTKGHNSISSNRGYKLYEDSHGFLWIGTSNGLNRFDKKLEHFTIYIHNDRKSGSLTNSFIRSILEDKKAGCLWIGTQGGGLNRLDLSKDIFSSFTTKDGLPNNCICGILQDKKGNLWLSTYKGISCFNTVTQTCNNYTWKDGLQNDEFRPGVYFAGQSGRFYFGGIQGLNMFFPDSITKNLIKPRIVFTELRIYNRVVNPGEAIKNHLLLPSALPYCKEISIPQRFKVFSIEFSALHFKNPEMNRYMYMLDGFDNTWNQTNSSQRVITYTNLPGGTYTLKVSAANSDNVWTTEFATLTICIKPPFYKTMLFFILLALLLLSVFLFLIRKREKKLIFEKDLFGYDSNLLQTLMDNIPDTIYFKDKISRFIKINKKKAAEIGLTEPKEAIGKSDFDFFEHDDALAAYNDEQRIIQSGTPLINKLEKRLKQGVENWYLATKVPMYNETGTIIGTAGFTRNITEQIKMNERLEQARRQAEEADQLKTAFLANMSHEIRTPMNAIIGFSELIDDPALDEKEKKSYIDYIKHNGKALLSLIDDIIDSAKIESNQLIIKKTIYDLNKLLDELLVYYNQEKKQRNKDQLKIRLSKAIQSESFTIFTDPYRLKQVFHHLMNNALKYTDTGFIELGYHFKDKNTIELYVKDTGIGIPPEKLPNIFKRFSYADTRINTSNSGTGLGLSISKSLIELMGGSIRVESEPFKGTCFYFTLAIAEPT